MAPLYFLVYCVFTSALVSGQSTRYEPVGLEVNLKPNISGQPDQILWMHNGKKVVEFDGKEEQVYGSYAGRVTLDWISAELRIRDLRYEDSGEYESVAFMNIKLLRSRFTVEVIDKVSKPTISSQMNDGSSSDTPELQETLSVQLGAAIAVLFALVLLVICCYKQQHKDGRIVLCEMRPLFHRAPTCPSPQQLTQEELQGDRQPEDERIYLSDQMRPLLNSAPTCPSSQQHNQDKMPPEDFAVDIKKLVGFFDPTTGECTLPPDRPTDGRTDLSDENRPLFHRAPTYHSPQKLTQDERPLEDFAGKVKDRAQFYESLKDHVVSVKKLVEKFEPTNAECTLPPDTSTESVKADEDKESLPARGTSAPTAPPRSPLTQNSPNMESDAAGKPKEDTDSDQVTGEPAEESVRESDSSDLEKINGPHDSSEEKQSSTVPEEKGPEITVHEQDSNLPQYETHTQEGEHQEMNKQRKRGQDQA